MLGALYALVSAAAFAFNNVATRRGVINGSVFQGMVVTVPMGVVLFAIAAGLAGSLGAVTRFSNAALVYFALAGFAHFVFGRYCNYRAIAAIGTNLAAPIQQWEVLVTLSLAIVFLGERIGLLEVVGIGLLVLGPALATRGEPKKAPRSAGAAALEPAIQAKPARSFEPRYAEGYLFAFLTIFGYGSSPILIKAGLQQGSVGDSLAAGVVSYAAATIVVLVATVAMRQVGHVASIEPGPARWFFVAGVLVFLSHMFRYMALALMPAAIVAPILRIQSLFRIYFSWLIAREHEVFDRNVILGTLVSLAGALLVSLHTDWLVSVVHMPDAIKTALGWKWP